MYFSGYHRIDEQEKNGNNIYYAVVSKSKRDAT